MVHIMDLALYVPQKADMYQTTAQKIPEIMRNNNIKGE